MQILNCDETGITVVHHPVKIVTKFGCHTVYSFTYSFTSAEKEKTHTVFVYVSATGLVLLQLIIYPH